MNSITCTAIYKGKLINIITVLLDLDVAFIENDKGEIFNVRYSLIG